MSLIGKNIGNYIVRSKIGEGGMGAVYMGEHPLIGKKVAIKVLLDELATKEDVVQRFFQEAKSVNAIGHQNIVDIVDFGKVKDGTGPETVYFVMEYLEGEGLSSRIRRAGLQIPEVLHVMLQCCSALQASHAKHIVHRDLKPENIFLVPRAGDPLFVKLLDFGIAKLTGDGGATSSKTRTGIVIGTPAYMSPEQCEGKGQIDHRSDVYSIGVVMYELLTGRVPFPGDGFGEILVAHITKQPEAPSVLNPLVPPEIEAIVLHAIEKDKNRRFQSMDEMVQALRDPASHMQAYRPLPGYTPTNAAATMMFPGAVATGAPMPTGQSGPRTASVQRPTTLSGAAAEMGGGAPRRSMRGVVIAATAIVVAGLGIGGFLILGNKDKGGTTVSQLPPPEISANADVHITIRSDPPGATVMRADTGQPEADKTPLTLTVKKGSGGFDVVVKLEGYRPFVRSVTTDGDSAMLASLEKMAGPTVTQVAAPPPEPKEKVTVAPKPKETVASKPTPPREHHEHHTRPSKPPPGADEPYVMKPSWDK